MWRVEESGELTWLFGGDNVINMRQVRRFQLMRNSAAGDKLLVRYIDGSQDVFEGNAAVDIWKALIKTAKEKLG